MKHFKTDSGKKITAINIDAAKKIAADYNMGEIVGEFTPKSAKKPQKKYVVWDDLTQTVIASKLTLDAARKLAKKSGGHPVVTTWAELRA